MVTNDHWMYNQQPGALHSNILYQPTELFINDRQGFLCCATVIRVWSVFVFGVSLSPLLSGTCCIL